MLFGGALAALTLAVALAVELAAALALAVELAIALAVSVELAVALELAVAIALALPVAFANRVTFPAPAAVTGVGDGATSSGTFPRNFSGTKSSSTGESIGIACTCGPPT